MMLYQIDLVGLKAYGFHGVAEFEKQYGQEFVVDVGLFVDASEAAADDDINKTVHYGLLADAVVADVKSNPVNLLETLALRLANLVLAFDQRVQIVNVKVHKPNAPIDHPFTDVTVALTLGRDDVR